MQVTRVLPVPERNESAARPKSIDCCLLQSGVYIRGGQAGFSIADRKYVRSVRSHPVSHLLDDTAVSISVELSLE